MIGPAADLGSRETGPASAGALFLITRADPRDDGLEREAAGRGLRVARLRLLESEPGPDVEGLVGRLAAPAPGTLIAWTSRRAAETLLAAALPAGRGAMPPRGHALKAFPLYALGEESAAPVSAAGFRVEHPEGTPGAKRMGAWLLERARQSGLSRAVVLQGDRALPDLVEALRDGGLPVDALTVYRIRFLEPDTSPLAAELGAGTVAAAAYFSPSAADALERLLEEPARERLRRVPALARGETTYRALADRGYHQVLAPREEEGPFDRFAARALDQLRSRTG